MSGDEGGEVVDNAEPDLIELADADADAVEDEASDADEPSVPRDMVESARRRYGGVGAAVAASMLAIDELLGRKVKPDSVQVQEGSGQPLDLDEHGISMDVDDETRVEAPPLDRKPPLMATRRRKR